MRGSDNDFSGQSIRRGTKSDTTRHFLDSLNQLNRSRRMCFGREAAYLASELRLQRVLKMRPVKRRDTIVALERPHL